MIRQEIKVSEIVELNPSASRIGRTARRIRNALRHDTPRIIGKNAVFFSGSQFYGFQHYFAIVRNERDQLLGELQALTQTIFDTALIV